MWMDEDVLTQVSEAGPSRRGRRRAYSDAAIQMPLGLKLRKHAYPGFLPVPNYTTLSRRAQTLKVVLPMRHPDEMHLVIDSTALKAYGEGEWKVRKHGWSKRRTWRKVPVDAKTGRICAAVMTHQDECDGEVLPDLVDQIPADLMVDVIAGDGAYDTELCRAHIAAWRELIDSAARGSETVARSHAGRQLAQWSYCRYRRNQQARMEAGNRLPPAIARRELDVPAQGTHGLQPVGARLARKPPRRRSVLVYSIAS